MKVFIVSDNKRNGIALANVVNASGNIGIMSESDIVGPQQIASELESHRDSFRLAFVVAQKPIYVCTEVNKSEPMRAAVCNNAREVDEAKEAMVNVIVLRDSVFQKLNLNEIISASTGKEMPKTDGLQGNLSAKRIPQKQSKKQQQPQQADTDYDDTEDERPTQSSGKGKGIFGRLKNSLGIEE